MTAFLDELARSMAKPLPRRRALRLLGGATRRSRSARVRDDGGARGASRFHRCARSREGCCASATARVTSARGSAASRRRVRVLFARKRGVRRRVQEEGPAAPTSSAVRRREFLRELAATRLLLQAGRAGLRPAVLQSQRGVQVDPDRHRLGARVRKALPAGPGVVREEEVLSAGHRLLQQGERRRMLPAACCGSPRRTATSRGTFCCSGKRIQVPSAWITRETSVAAAAKPPPIRR